MHLEPRLQLHPVYRMDKASATASLSHARQHAVEVAEHCPQTAVPAGTLSVPRARQPYVRGLTSATVAATNTE